MRARGTKPCALAIYKMKEGGICLGKTKTRKSLPTWFHYTLMCLPGYIWLFLFSIVPMVGIVMAFQNYNPSKLVRLGLGGPAAL